MSCEGDVAIQVRDVTKHFLMYDRPEDRLKQMIVPRIERLVGREPRRYFRDFAAIDGVSFDVARGETVGIIGRNGCGKSTLLQIVCGILQPSSGSVEVEGRIAALLELGAGFNPEFTGRENVFMNAAILGLSRGETERRYDDIVRFADIGIFIDQPVKTYSSGMYVRLAFAVAINVDPDILVVDEALAVGDEAFQRKCFARIEEIKERGGTILFVSHGAQTIVQLCDWAMLIDRGEKILEGKPKTVVNQYQRFVNQTGEAAEVTRAEIVAMDGWATADLGEALEQAVQEDGPDRVQAHSSAILQPAPEDADDSWFDPTLVSESKVEYESKGALIRDMRLVNARGERVNVLAPRNTYFLEYAVDVASQISGVIFGMQIKTTSGVVLAGANNSSVSIAERPRVTPGDVITVRFQFSCRFTPSTLLVDFGVMGPNGFEHRVLDALIFRVLNGPHSLAVGYFDLQPELQFETERMTS